MFGLFAKKSFFDGWDHLAGLALVNGGFFLALLPLLGAGIPGLPFGLSLALGALAFLLVACWFAFSSLVTLKFSDYGNFAFAETPGALRAALLPGLQLGLIGLGLGLALFVGLPFYLGRGLLGSLAAGFLIWLSLSLLLALQFYLPLRYRLGGGFAKNLRKSFILLLDNPGFSLFLFIWSLGSLLVSAVLAFLAPGGAGVALAQNVALRLRLKKYDWLEGLPVEEKGRGPVPWKELLAEERELVGPRTLKGMIFPWKE